MNANTPAVEFTPRKAAGTADEEEHETRRRSPAAERGRLG
jgi:hypothetical protein